MEITFRVEKTSNFSDEEKKQFVELLVKQDQIDNPTIDKVNSCSFICMVYCDSLPVGIGAIKQVYKSPFDKAGVSGLKNEYEVELGYLFVDSNSNLRGLGLGKTISKLLLAQIKQKSVFATTEEIEGNPMFHILLALGFVKLGNTYLGGKTGKSIALFVKK